MTERRAHLRFQVSGSSRAAVVAAERFRLLNVGLNGALVESEVPLPEHAEYRVQLVLQGHLSEATAKVRRTVRIHTESTARYLIGMEFLSLSPEAHEIIASFVSARNSAV